MFKSSKIQLESKSQPIAAPKLIDLVVFKSSKIQLESKSQLSESADPRMIVVFKSSKIQLESKSQLAAATLKATNGCVQEFKDTIRKQITTNKLPW